MSSAEFPAAGQSGASSPVVPALSPRLDAARQNVIRLRAILCLLYGVAAMFGLVLLAALADWYWEYSWSMRAATTGLSLAAAFGGIVWAIQRWAKSYSLPRAAADFEAIHPTLGQRLRTLVDYENPQSRPTPASPQMVQALRQQAAAVVTGKELTQLAHERRLLSGIAVLASAALLFFLTVFLIPEMPRAVGRVLLLPLEYTRVTYSPTESIIKQGESVTIEATIEGRPIASARVLFRPASGNKPWQERSLFPTDETETQQRRSGEFDLMLENCQEDTVFRVVAGPRELPLGTIRVLQPLTVESMHARVTPPAYTGRPSFSSDQLELKVPEGSDVELRFTLNRPASIARLSPQPGRSTSEGATTNPTELSCQENQVSGKLVDLRSSCTFDLEMTTSDGVQLEPTKLVVRVQPDRPPIVRFVRPPEELEVIPTTEVTLTVQAEDDLALRKIGILYQVGDGPPLPLAEQVYEPAPGIEVAEAEMAEADERSDTAKVEQRVQLAPTIMLEEHQLTHQDSVSYYAFAEDEYFGELRRVVTPLRFVDIRPFRRTYQMLDNGGT